MMEQDVPHVEQLKLTPDQINSAFERASENAQHWPEWNDPYKLKTIHNDHSMQIPKSGQEKSP